MVTSGFERFTTIVPLEPTVKSRDSWYGGGMPGLCGIDEAGRGPLAGPVTAAAVILPDTFPCDELSDSKKIAGRRREQVARLIVELSVAWAVGWASPREIDNLNILQASLLAMQRAVRHLPMAPDRVLVDGLHAPRLDCPAETVVRGDSLIPEIMAASILAKTRRDAWMRDYHKRDPRFGFDRNVGYPTREHRQLLREYGPSVIHRVSFRVS